MRRFFRTRAFARALTLNLGVILGLVAGATFLAGDAQSRPEHVYAVAAQTGYAMAASRPAPVLTAPAARLASAPTFPRRPAASPRSLECLAAAVYYEARGESGAGRAAVAQVVLNRIHRGGWPKSVCAVVYQGRGSGDCQFSFVCNGAMREPREHSAWRDARKVAARVMAGEASNLVGAATYFHAVWAGAHPGAIRVGGQLFYT